MAQKTKAQRDAERDRAKKGIRARQDAISTLIERHRDEFDELHMKNRVAAGLPPRTAGPSLEKLEERIKRQREQLARWEDQLRAAQG